MSKTPFSLPTNLTQTQLSVVRECVRNIKATDEIDPKILSRLSDRDLEDIQSSDVVRSIVHGNMPQNLADFTIEVLAKEIDKILRRDEIAAQERQATAAFYAGNETFGMF